MHTVVRTHQWYDYSSEVYKINVYSSLFSVDASFNKRLKFVMKSFAITRKKSSFFIDSTNFTELMISYLGIKIYNFLLDEIIDRCLSIIRIVSFNLKIPVNCSWHSLKI